jgi:hypothetical protein
MRLLGPLMRRDLRKRNARFVRNLKDLLEGYLAPWGGATGGDHRLRWCGGRDRPSRCGGILVILWDPNDPDAHAGDETATAGSTVTVI